MDIKTISVALVAVMVGAVMFGALIPIFDDVTATEDTFTNTGKWRMAPNTNGDTYTYNNTTKEWSLNGTVVNNANSAVLSVILLDDCTIRSNGWIRGAQLTGNSVTTVVTNANDQTVVSGNGLSGNGTYDIQGYGVNPTGAYLLTDYNVPVYMNGDSDIYATGLTTVGNSLVNIIFHIEGNIKDGVTITSAPVYKSSYTMSDVVIDDVVINYEEVDGYLDLYKLNGITFNYSATVTNTDDPTDIQTVSDFACSYSSYVVPYEVTAERSVHVTDSMGAIMDLIPLIIGLGLVLVTIAYFIRKQ